MTIRGRQIWENTMSSIMLIVLLAGAGVTDRSIVPTGHPDGLIIEAAWAAPVGPRQPTAADIRGVMPATPPDADRIMDRKLIICHGC